ncbi:MAG: hypothetical protein ABJN26_14485 [Stappiaceae bacterium]
MTDTSEGRYEQPLGIGDIISETFSILIGNIQSVLIMGGIPSLISLLLTWGILGAAFVTGGLDPDPTDLQDGFNGFGMFIVSLISFAIYGIVLALFVQLAYDSKLGRSVQPMRYIQPALGSVVHIVLLTIIITLLVIIPLMLFIVPGLWVYAVFSVCIPAVIIERAGFGALGRSVSLTKEYRWPIVGLIVVFGVIFVLINLAGTFVAGMIPGGPIIGIIVLSVIYSVVYGMSGILVALIYARLKEIKEGASVNDLVAIFD